MLTAGYILMACILGVFAAIGYAVSRKPASIDWDKVTTSPGASPKNPTEHI